MQQNPHNPVCSLESGGALNAYYATGAHLSVASGRLSYTFGFKGPAMTVDTACSSSLVTTHLAARGLERGECEAAGSVGVNLTLVHSWTRACLRAGMLSEEGRCKTLDAFANGYVRAEAVGAVMLALATADEPSSAWQALALLAGSAVNQDGRSSSLTAPNGPSQQEVVRAALAAGKHGAWEVANLQMHGTGTSLGDPIEVGAAAAVLLKPSGNSSSCGGGSSPPMRPVPLVLTAAKSFMGHAEPAAGVVGLTRLALALGEAFLDPVLHLTSGEKERGGWGHRLIPEYSTSISSFSLLYSQSLRGICDGSRHPTRPCLPHFSTSPASQRRICHLCLLGWRQLVCFPGYQCSCAG